MTKLFAVDQASFWIYFGEDLEQWSVNLLHIFTLRVSFASHNTLNMLCGGVEATYYIHHIAKLQKGLREGL